MRSLSRFGFGVLFLALAGNVRGQDAVSGISAEMIENALKSLRVDHEAEGDRFTFLLRNRPVELARHPSGGRILVKASFTQKPPLEVLNRYNEEFAQTTRAVNYAKAGLILEAGLDGRLGVTERGLAIFLRQFGDDIAQFEKFLLDSKITGTVRPNPAKPSDPRIGEAPSTVGEAPSRNPTTEKPEPSTKSTEKPDPRPKQKPEPAPKPQPEMPSVAAPGKAPLKFLDAEQKAFEIHFPTNDDEKDTGWKIHWDMVTADQAIKEGFGFPKSRGKDTTLLFKIAKAYFKPNRTSPWIQVLEDAHPSEFYVPYFFRGVRFYDLRDVGSYATLLAHEGGPTGVLLGKKKQVMAEVRDRGLAYKHGHISRRAEELTLWGNFVAGNYTYLVEFGFQDDGTIAFRHAPTGYNYSHRFDHAHMHNCYWKVGMKLGPDGLQRRNFAEIVRVPTDPKAAGKENGKLEATPISKEGFADWNPLEFTRIRVFNPDIIVVPENAAEKRPPLPLSYELVPYGAGQSRHNRYEDEAFSMHDFWITRGDCKEKLYVNLHKYFAKPGNAQPLGAGPITLWHVSSTLHSPRGEDGILGGNSQNNGQALVHFTQFELVPRNVSTRTPLYRIPSSSPRKKSPPIVSESLE